MRACQCGFCRAHGVLSTSDPGGRIDFVARDRDCVQAYRFGLRTGDILVCRRCGTYIGAVIRTAEGRFGIVNLRALKERPHDLPRSQPASYDAEDADARTARREQRWTPVGRMPGD